MAQKEVQLDEDTFSCSICLDLLKEPVTIPCGHSYCLRCIQTFWDGEDHRACSCPQCRKDFTPRPNTTSRQQIQDQEKDVKLLQEEVEAINVSADQTVEDTEEIFTQLIRLIQKRRSDVKQQIRSQQETEVRRVLELQEKLEQEITELKRKDSELEQLSHTEDHNQFLHNSQSVSAFGESPHSSSIKVHPRRYFENITAAVEELRDKLQDVLRDMWTNISLRGPDVSLCEPEPKSREEFLKYSRQLTFDPNSAHRSLIFSEDNRKVTSVEEHLSPPDHPDRFTGYEQVLSREALTGRSYWEVEWSGRGEEVRVAVAYRSLSRAGRSDESRFGFNDSSWALDCFSHTFSFWHSGDETLILARLSFKLGVYLDHTAGVLSFYSVSGTMTLLHRVQTTFTQPLHAGVRFYDSGDSAEFVQLN